MYNVYIHIYTCVYIYIYAYVHVYIYIYMITLLVLHMCSSKVVQQCSTTRSSMTRNRHITQPGQDSERDKRGQH